MEIKDHGFSSFIKMRLPSKWGQPCPFIQARHPACVFTLQSHLLHEVSLMTLAPPWHPFQVLQTLSPHHLAQCILWCSIAHSDSLEVGFSSPAHIACRQQPPLPSLFPPLVPTTGWVHRASFVHVCQWERCLMRKRSERSSQRLKRCGAPGRLWRRVLSSASLDQEGNEIDPFPSTSLWVFPSVALGKAALGWLSVAVTSWNWTHSLDPFWKRDHESLLTLLAPGIFPWTRPREWSRPEH